MTESAAQQPNPATSAAGGTSYRVGVDPVGGLATGRRGSWSARLWLWLVAEGVIGVIAGGLAVIYPGVTVLILALLLGFGLLLQGAFEVLAVAEVVEASRRWWMAAVGVVTVVAGLICLIHPGAGVFALIIGLTVWFMTAAVNDIVRAVQGPEHRVWNAILGGLTFVGAVVLVVQPGLAIATVALIAGLGFIVRGVLDIGLGLAVRHAGAAS